MLSIYCQNRTRCHFFGCCPNLLHAVRCMVYPKQALKIHEAPMTFSVTSSHWTSCASELPVTPTLSGATVVQGNAALLDFNIPNRFHTSEQILPII